MSADPSDLASRARREFLKSSGAGVAALAIGFTWTARKGFAAPAAAAAGELVPNAFVRIGADESVTVIAKHLEMGQGSYTGLATILAEELDADWTRVRVESAPADAKRYANLVFKTMQGTGGSSAMANSWQQLRQAGASARALLVSAAARQWGVPVTGLRAERGVVYHDARRPSGRSSRLPPRCRCRRRSP
jgi:isoquinoline 1-oxidoreductase beta subunit